MVPFSSAGRDFLFNGLAFLGSVMENEKNWLGKSETDN